MEDHKAGTLDNLIHYIRSPKGKTWLTISSEHLNSPNVVLSAGAIDGLLQLTKVFEPSTFGQV
jgi:hypothetical protein